MNDDQYFLANAYLDGELTADELQIAEADRDVMSEVERLRAVQALVRTPGPPDPDTRTAAIAAAMAQFSATHSNAATTSTNETTRSPETVDNRTRERKVVPFARPRRQYGRYLSLAAACVAVGVVGVVIANGIGGSDDSDGDFSASQETLALEATDSAARVGDEPELDDAGMAAADTADGADEFAESSPVDAPMVDMQAGDAADDGDAGTTMGAAEMSLPADAYPVTGGPIEPITDLDQTLTTPGQLAGLGVRLAELRAAGELPPTPNTRCVLDDPQLQIVDETTYRDDQATRQVLVALIDDGIEGHAATIDPDTCEILVVGP